MLPIHQQRDKLLYPPNNSYKLPLCNRQLTMGYLHLRDPKPVCFFVQSCFFFLLALDELLMLNSSNLSSHDQRQKEKLIIAVELG